MRRVLRHLLKSRPYLRSIDPSQLHALYISPARTRFARTMASQTIGQWQELFDSRAKSASNDFRSDTFTLPSGSMLSSILLNAGAMGDDVFGEDEATNSLESHVSELTGMKGAVFVSSGSMGNQLAIRCWLKQPPYSVVCDRRSHIMEHECGMTSIFSQALLIPVMPNLEKQAYITLEEIIPAIVPDDGNTHGAPTRVITLENTFWGKVTPVEEVRRIADYARERNIKLHMDGARLWNACYTSATASLEPAEAAKAARTRLQEYCALLDSVSLCFSKSLGAPAGSILLSKSSEFLQKARHFRKALGGGMRQVGVLSSPARVAVNEVFLSGIHMPRANAMAKEIEEAWIGCGGQIQAGLSQETNMVWMDLKKAQVKDQEFVDLAKEEGVKVFGGRIATHYQITPEAIEALKRVFERTIALGKGRSHDPEPERSAGGNSYNLGDVAAE